MPYIKVNVDKIKKYQQDVYNIRKKVNTISSNFSNISSRLDSDVKNSSGIRRKLNNIEATLSDHKTVLQRSNTFFVNTSLKYTNTEKTLYAKDHASGNAQYADIDEVAETIAKQRGLPSENVKNVILSGKYDITEVLQNADSINADNSFANEIKDLAITTALNSGSRKWLLGSASTVKSIFSTTNIVNPKYKLASSKNGIGFGLANTIFGVASVMGTIAGGSDEKEEQIGYWNGGWSTVAKGSVLSGSKVTTGEKSQTLATGSVLTGSASASLKPGDIKYENDDIISDFLKDDKGVNIPQQKKIQDESKQVNKDEDFYDKAATILETKAEAKLEGSVLEGKVQGSNDWAEGSIEGKLLTGEMHASAAAGLYVYTKDKDGNMQKMFSPGVSAEVGASVAVVQVEAEGRIGLGEDNNMLGVYGKVNAEVGSAEAKAKVSLNAKEVYAGASAEADLCKIEGTAGISVLGTDIGVTGALKVGVGAHAEIGYTDGKLKVDIGAAIGVGFDLGFEIDVKGTVDAVVDTCKNAWEDTKKAVKNFFKGW